MPWPKLGVNHYYALLEHPDNGVAIKDLVGCI